MAICAGLFVVTTAFAEPPTQPGEPGPGPEAGIVPKYDPAETPPTKRGQFGLVAEVLDELAMSPKHVAKIDYISMAIMSPDGARIAYSRSIPRDPYEVPGEMDPEFEDGLPRSELYVMTVADGKSSLFVGRYCAIGGIRWLPDSSGLSFTAKRPPDKEKSLYVISLGGGEARRVLAHETDIGAYSWSPDGTRVAFIATPDEPKAKASLKKKGFKAEVYEEEYRPSKLWISRVADGASVPDADAVSLDGHVSDVSWSPDGAKIMVKVAPTPLTDDVYMKQKIQIVDVGSRKVTATIENPGKLGDVEWSPDGQHLAMISAEDINDPSEGRLMVTGVDGGEMRDLLPGVEGHVKSIGWQGNGTLMYVIDVGCQTQFGKVNIDGANQKTIVAESPVILGSMSMAEDGMSAAFIGSLPTHGPELYYMKHGDTEPKKMTDCNPWLAMLHFGKQEVVEYKARDGLMIQGILIHPVGEKPGVRYPLIVCVHGGPEAHESNGWLTNYSRPGQVAAGRGFAVLYPNYRGSTGRGVKFSKLDQADYAGAEFDDLVDGVKYLVDRGLVDEKKVGVTGGSYGGYASAWCATKLTEHFAASVMFVGISDLVSKVGTTDIPNEMYLVHARKWPFEDDNWDWFRSRSPIYYTPQARTPLLILHGKDDPRVHPSQSLELYRYLKTIGKVPVRLVWYPGEGHGNGKAAARLDYNLRMMQWFEHYLKGPGGEPPADEIDYGLPEKKGKKGAEAKGE